MKPSFHKKLLHKEKKCPATVRSFVVRRSAKIASGRPQIKPLSGLVTTAFLNTKFGEVENKIRDHAKYIATIESDKFASSIFDKNKLSNK